MNKSSHETQHSVSDWAMRTYPGAHVAGAGSAVRVLAPTVRTCLAAGADGVRVMEAVRTAIDDHLRDSVPGFDELTPEEQGRLRARPEPESDKVPAGAADVLISLYVLAGVSGFELLHELDRAMASYRAGRPDGDMEDR